MGVVAYQASGNCYLNITNQCTLRCEFCPKFRSEWNIAGHDLRLDAKPSVREIVDAVGDPCRYKEVVFSGLGEPTIRLYTLLQAAELLHRQGGYVRVETDGLASLRQGHDVTPLFNGCVDSVSVSMQAPNGVVYDRVCRPTKKGAYSAMLDFIRQARRHVPTVVTSAIEGLPGINIEGCRRTAQHLGVRFRCRQLDQFH